jgi:hypothetical protein
MVALETLLGFDTTIDFDDFLNGKHDVLKMFCCLGGRTSIYYPTIRTEPDISTGMRCPVARAKQHVGGSTSAPQARRHAIFLGLNYGTEYFGLEKVVWHQQNKYTDIYRD